MTLNTMHAYRFGMNFEETIVTVGTVTSKLTEAYQTVHLKELTDFPKKDQEDPTEVFTDFHFWGRSVAYELEARAYHMSHGLGSYQ